MAHVAVVGVGAIGGALAGLLQTAGRHRMTLCTRRRMEALTVHTREGDVHVEATNVIDRAKSGAVDWVFVSTKAYDAEGAASWFPALCANGAKVAIVQNGVEHRERFAPYLSADRLLPVVIDCPTERCVDGSVNVRGETLMKVEIRRSEESLQAFSREHRQKPCSWVTSRPQPGVNSASTSSEH